MTFTIFLIPTITRFGLPDFQLTIDLAYKIRACHGECPVTSSYYFLKKTAANKKSQQPFPPRLSYRSLS